MEKRSTDADIATIERIDPYTSSYNTDGYFGQQFELLSYLDQEPIMRLSVYNTRQNEMYKFTYTRRELEALIHKTTIALEKLKEAELQLLLTK